MTDTDRNQLMTPGRNEFVFEGEYIDQIYFGCFSHKIYVVIKQKTLYLYASQEEYQEKPEEPKMFFNLNFINCTLDDDFV